MHIAGITLAITGLTTAGAFAATSPGTPRGEHTAVLESLAYVPRPAPVLARDVRDDAAVRKAQAAQAAAAKAAAAKAQAARVAAAKAAAARAAAARARVAAARAAAARAANARLAAARAAAASRAASASRATRSTTRAPIVSGNPRAIAAAMLGSFGWSSSQFSCLDSLWNRESGWSVHASNPSGAYGIPQALPGSKMGAYGSDWASNPRTQITWGLHYIAARYGTPCGAWAHSQSYNWY
jgi:hypothetical protein